MDNLLLIFLTITSLCYGSFVNVLIYRLPNEISILKPRSFCPNCKTFIPFYRNIPIISFVLQNGKCHSCRKKISLQYPAVELLTGFLWFYFIIQGDTSILHTSFSIIIISFLIPLAIIDAKHLYFPISLIIPLIIISISMSMIELLSFNNTNPIFGMGTALFFLGSIYLIVKILLKLKKEEKEPMGMGDMLLVVPLGIWLGPLGILLCLFLSSVLALIFWFLLYLLKDFNFSQRMPFGPYLIGISILIKVTDLSTLISVLISQIK